MEGGEAADPLAVGSEGRSCWVLLSRRNKVVVKKVDNGRQI